jgi:hypothetical protein
MSSVNHEGGTIPIGVFIGLGVLEVAVISCGLKAGADADRAAAVSASPTSTPSCLMSETPIPSERAYSAKTPDGSSVSVLPSVTVFDTKTCPPSSR